MRTGVFSSVLSVGPAAHSGCASDKRRFSSAAGDESAAFKTGSSAGNTERDYFRRRTYGTVRGEWIWISVCGGIYSCE